MITNSNRSYFVKMVDCGFQEEVNAKLDSACKVKS
jgi:hypothetical protein